MSKKHAAAEAVMAEAPAQEAKTKPATAERAPVKIDLSKYTVKLTEPAKRMKYWVGVTDACPQKPVHLAGQDFPHTVTPPRLHPDGTTSRDTLYGQVVSLADADVEKIKEAAAFKVVHWNGPRTKAWVYDRRNVNYTPHPDHEPIAKYVYMIPVEERMPGDFRRAPSSDTMA